MAFRKAAGAVSKPHGKEDAADIVPIDGFLASFLDRILPEPQHGVMAVHIVHAFMPAADQSGLIDKRE